MIRSSLFAFAFLSYINGNCQERDTISCTSEKVVLSKDISVFIQGRKNSKSIKRRFFHRNFKLEVSDPFFQIVSFRMVWDNRRKSILVARKNYGSLVTPGFEEVVNNKEAYSLKNLEPGTFLTFDCIIIKKGDTYYTVSPFGFNVSL